MGVTQGLIEGPLVRGPEPTIQNRKLVFTKVPS